MVGLAFALTGTANAVESHDVGAFVCPLGSAMYHNPTAEIAPVFEFPGTGEAFMSVPPGGQVCTDDGRANGPDGVYYHFTGDGVSGPADGWIHERFVA